MEEIPPAFGVAGDPDAFRTRTARPVYVWHVPMEGSDYGLSSDRHCQRFASMPWVYEFRGLLEDVPALNALPRHLVDERTRDPYGMTVMVDNLGDFVLAGGILDYQEA